MSQEKSKDKLHIGKSINRTVLNGFTLYSCQNHKEVKGNKREIRKHFMNVDMGFKYY